MPDLGDFDLRDATDEPTITQPAPAPRIPKLLVALVIVAAAISAYLLYGLWQRQAPAPARSAAPVQATSEPSQPVTETPAVEVPPLGESDGFVRQLVRGLSSHPTVASWLATPDLIRNFTVVVTNIADGGSPSRHLARLQPASKFRVVARGAIVHVDPRSYDRYTPIADAVAAVDPAAVAQVYRTLKPRIEEANQELGAAHGSFDATLERAIVLLLSTPIPREPVELVPSGAGYGFADPRLEGLRGAQKQLLRFGPQNVRMIQHALRNFATALGIPADRLPEPKG